MARRAAGNRGTGQEWIQEELVQAEMIVVVAEKGQPGYDGKTDRESDFEAQG